MICTFCGQVKKLIQAHVIPEAFFRRLREGKRAPLLLRQHDYPKRAPIGVYDAEMLCADCEAQFGAWDDYAQGLLSDDLPEGTALRDEHGEVIGWVVRQYRYDLLKLFFISLVWRASVSRQPFYRRIDLGPFEPRAKALIAARDPGPPEAFGVVLARFREDDLAVAMLDPHKQTLDANYVQFYLGGYVAYIKTDSRPASAQWKPFTMKPEGPLYLLAREMSRSKELGVMRKVFALSKQPKGGH